MAESKAQHAAGECDDLSCLVCFPEDNVCTYCKQDKGAGGILAVTECEHFVSSDQCEDCPTDQVCFECDAKSGGAISAKILGA